MLVAISLMTLFLLKDSMGAAGFSDCDLKENATRFVDHCSLLREINHEHFRIWIASGLERDVDEYKLSWRRHCFGQAIPGGR
jgi:hypothetical protein